MCCTQDPVPIEELIGEGMEWMESNGEASKAEINGYRKKLERKISSLMVKLYTR